MTSFGDLADALTKIPHNEFALTAGVIISYAIGNISPAIILGKIYGVDVRSEGSGNAGTTNVLRTIGKKAGVITLLIDVGKGFLVAFIAMLIGGLPYAMFCGLAVILGHMWPAFYDLKGGKGVATTFGVLLAVEPLLAVALILIVGIMLLVTQRMSVSVLVAAILAIPISYFFHPWHVYWITVIVVLIVLKHNQNIKRIIAGTEPKMSFKKSDEA